MLCALEDVLHKHIRSCTDDEAAQLRRILGVTFGHGMPRSGRDHMQSPIALCLNINQSANHIYIVIVFSKIMAPDRGHSMISAR